MADSTGLGYEGGALLAESARTAEARDALAPVYGAFTEGFERPDLQAANSLLAELS